MYNNNIDPLLLRTTFAVNPNRYSIEVTKNMSKQFEKAKNQGLALFDNTNTENVLIKDLEKYNKTYEPIIVKQEKQDEYNNSIVGQINNTLNDVYDNTIGKMLNISNIFDYKNLIFMFLIIIIVIKI